MDCDNEQGVEMIGCCLDCRWLELRGEFYGRTSYWCALRDKEVPSSRAARRACDDFKDWRES